MNQSATSEPLRTLATVPNPDPNNWSTRRINAVLAGFPAVERLGIQRYLEIGLESGRTLENVLAPHRVGVDPNPRFDTHVLPDGVEIHSIPSDDYFARLPRRTAFDIVFVDGLHTYEQTYRDVINAFRHCPNGVLLIDDVVPSDWISAIPDQAESLEIRRQHGIDNIDWHGDVFKVILMLRDHHPELDWVTITDRGNPQTFVWRQSKPSAGRGPNRRGRARIRSVSDAVVDSYRGVSYADVFDVGVPSYFHPCEEAEALPRVIDGLTQLRSRPRPLLRRP
jgi:hypothetical protein